MSKVEKDQVTQTEMVTIPDDLALCRNTLELTEKLAKHMAGFPPDVRNKIQMIIETQGKGFIYDVKNDTFELKPDVIRVILNSISSETE